MTATKDFLHQQLKDSVSKALGLAVSAVSVRGATLTITVPVEGPSAESLFWKAVLEQADADGAGG